MILNLLFILAAAQKNAFFMKKYYEKKNYFKIINYVLQARPGYIDIKLIDIFYLKRFSEKYFTVPRPKISCFSI